MDNLSSLIKALILSILPVSELRGGIPLAISSGINVFTAFFLCTLANIIIIPFIFFFLDHMHKHLMKIKIYEKGFNIYIKRLRKRVSKRINHWQYWVLFSFVAIPFPGSGAYTGCVVAWLFKLHRKKSIITIALGVLAAGIIVTLASLGILKLFWWK